MHAQTRPSRAQVKGHRRQPRPRTLWKGLGAPKPRPLPTRCRGVLQGPRHGEPPGPLCSGVTRAVGGCPDMEDADAAAGPAVRGRAEQTGSCPRGGWHSRHFSTSINQALLANEGETRGLRQVGPCARSPRGGCPTQGTPSQDWPLLGPHGTDATCWAEQGCHRAQGLGGEARPLCLRCWSLCVLHWTWAPRAHLRASLALSLPPGTWGEQRTCPTPGCGQGSTGQRRRRAWPRAPHMASAE